MDLNAAISILTGRDGFSYTLQSEFGSHMEGVWADPSAALFAAVAHATRAGASGRAVVFRDGGTRFAHIDLDCPAPVESLVWTSSASAAA